MVERILQFIDGVSELPPSTRPSASLVANSTSASSVRSNLREIALDIERAVEDAKDRDGTFLLDQIGDPVVAVEKNANRPIRTAPIAVAHLREGHEHLRFLVDPLHRPRRRGGIVASDIAVA